MRVPSVEPSQRWWVRGLRPARAEVGERVVQAAGDQARDGGVPGRRVEVAHDQPRQRRVEPASSASALRSREAAEAPSQWALATPNRSPVSRSENRHSVTMRGIGLPHEREPGGPGVSENQRTVHASSGAATGR